MRLLAFIQIGFFCVLTAMFEGCVSSEKPTRPVAATQTNSIPNPDAELTVAVAKFIEVTQKEWDAAVRLLNGNACLTNRLYGTIIERLESGQLKPDTNGVVRIETKEMLPEVGRERR